MADVTGNWKGWANGMREEKLERVGRRQLGCSTGKVDENRCMREETSEGSAIRKGKR